jgi:twitching motility protein PilI
MVSGLNLRQYQEGILARLDSASQSGVVERKNYLAVSVGGQGILVDMSQVSEVLPVPTIYPAPNTQPWFLGTVNVRGHLYAVSDLAAFLKYQSTDSNLNVKKSDWRILLLQANISPHTAILTQRLIGLRRLENLKQVSSAQISNLSDRIEADGVEAHQADCFLQVEFEDDEGSLWQVLDCLALVNEQAFMQAGLV